MSPALAVKTRLLQLSGVTALVSTRVYVDVLPQKPTLPAIRVQRISEVDEVHLRGTQAARRARVQVDALSMSLAEATDVSEAANGPGDGTGLSGWVGSLGGSPSTEVLAVLPVDVRSDYTADELREYRVSRDYFVWMRG